MLLFYLIAFGYSWGVWLVGILLGGTMDTTVLVSIGGIGPLIAAVVHFIWSYDKPQKKDYLSRIVRVRRVPAAVWLIAIAAPFVITGVAGVAGSLIAGEPVRPFVLQAAFVQAGWTYPLFLLMFGPLPEEFSWRGVALDTLAAKSVLRGQVIVALLWALWHVPLFFVKGSIQNNLGLFTPDFYLFFVNLLMLAIITGWVYLQSGRSILLAIIVHYMINLTGEMFVQSLRARIIRAALYTVLTIVLLARQISASRHRSAAVTMGAQ